LGIGLEEAEEEGEGEGEESFKDGAEEDVTSFMRSFILFFAMALAAAGGEVQSTAEEDGGGLESVSRLRHAQRHLGSQRRNKGGAWVCVLS
jgi:hypothetical protein